jgi:hypothetical protein
MSSFGGTIPVVALNLGFLGNVSRLGERVIAARQVLSTSTNPVSFGDAVVIVPDSTGGTYQNVKDYIAGGGTFTAAKFAGIAVRNVKTQLVYSALSNVQTTLIGQYAQGNIAEALERGSVTVKINNGTPVSQNPVYIRTALDAAIPAGLVGGLEAVTDANPVATTMGTTSGSPNITVASGTGITVGATAVGTGIPANTSVISVAGTAVVLSANATATAASGVAVTFSHTVALTNVVFRTGVLDANGVAEITLLQRVAA